MIDLQSDNRGVVLAVKVVPGASRTRIVGLLGDRLKVAVAAPPEHGKANAELTAVLAGVLGVKRRDVTVERGHSSPMKSVRIAGRSADQVRQALEDLLHTP